MWYWFLVFYLLVFASMVTVIALTDKYKTFLLIDDETNIKPPVQLNYAQYPDTSVDVTFTAQTGEATSGLWTADKGIITVNWVDPVAMGFVFPVPTAYEPCISISGDTVVVGVQGDGQFHVFACRNTSAKTKDQAWFHSTIENVDSLASAVLIHDGSVTVYVDVNVSDGTKRLDTYRGTVDGLMMSIAPTKTAFGYVHGTGTTTNLYVSYTNGYFGGHLSWTSGSVYLYGDPNAPSVGPFTGSQIIMTGYTATPDGSTCRVVHDGLLTLTGLICRPNGDRTVFFQYTLPTKYVGTSSGIALTFVDNKIRVAVAKDDQILFVTIDFGYPFPIAADPASPIMMINNTDATLSSDFVIGQGPIALHGNTLLYCDTENKLRVLQKLSGTGNYVNPMVNVFDMASATDSIGRVHQVTRNASGTVRHFSSEPNSDFGTYFARVRLTQRIKK